MDLKTQLTKSIQHLKCNKHIKKYYIVDTIPQYMDTLSLFDYTHIYIKLKKGKVKVGQSFGYASDYIYIYSFSRCFYPK